MHTPLTRSSGAMVMLPVPTEGTVDHVAATLPSDNHLTILVNADRGASKLVCLPRVLRALKWLKENNSQYEDVRRP